MYTCMQFADVYNLLISAVAPITMFTIVMNIENTRTFLSLFDPYEYNKDLIEFGSHIIEYIFFLKNNKISVKLFISII